MKPHHDTTLPPAAPTSSDIGRWPLRLLDIHARLAPRFARAEPRRRALRYLQAVISDLPRKNGWQIAEHAKEARPYGMQRLLSRAVWDHDGVRDDLRTLLSQALAPPALPAEPPEPSAPFPVLVIDESGFPKRGEHSAGVQPQYCGSTGRVENCQVGVFLADKWSLENSHLSGDYVALTLASSIVFKDNEGQFHIISYVTAQGHGLIDRELYLPQDWCHDPARRLAAHIPQSATFQTKPALATLMLQRAQSAGLPIAWVVADTVYGHSPDLRAFVEAQGYAYAFAVPCTEVICVHTSHGYLLDSVAHIAELALGQEDWQPLSQSLGSKGERLFDWAILPWVQAGQVDGRHFLVVRRCQDSAQELAYYLVFAPLATTLPTIVRAIGARWRIEEDLQANKALGLDHYEVRSYVGWYRHLTLVMLTSAVLLSICIHENRSPPASASVPGAPLAPATIALTTSEVRHLLARLIWPAPTSAALICQWSWWRRTHQYWAGYYHRRRRQKAGATLRATALQGA